MKRLIAALLFFCSSAVPAWAQIEETDLPPVLELFEAPAKELGVAKDVTVAIAGVESGLSPWVLNIEGRSYHFDSKEKALAKAREAWAAGQSFDSGLMQINSQWLRRFGITLEAALDPLANVYFGTWILKQEIDRHKNIRSAVGAYHSPTPNRANRYADQVMDALERGPTKATTKPTHRPAPEPQVETKAAIAPASSGLVVISKKAGLATPGTMKATATRPADSMKITTKKVSASNQKE